jgi:hypothetical protein
LICRQRLHSFSGGKWRAPGRNGSPRSKCSEFKSAMPTFGSLRSTRPPPEPDACSGCLVGMSQIAVSTPAVILASVVLHSVHPVWESNSSILVRASCSEVTWWFGVEFLSCGLVYQRVRECGYVPMSSFLNEIRSFMKSTINGWCGDVHFGELAVVAWRAGGALRSTTGGNRG